jgi:hypothetical protein
MKSKFIIAALMFILSMTCFAAPAKKETIDELFNVMQAQKMMDSVYGQMDGMFKQMAQGMNIPESQKPILDKFFVKYTALVKEEMSWEKLKDPMADAYASVYTESEVKNIIKFYRSSAGQKMLVKMPELMQASMSIVQSSMKNLMPKITELQNELTAELKEEGAKKQ